MCHIAFRVRSVNPILQRDPLRVRFSLMETQNRLSLLEWEKIFAEQQASGLIVSRFCEGRGFTAGSFRSAMKRKMTVLAKAGDQSLATVRPSATLENSVSDNTPLSSPFVSLRVRPVTGGDSPDAMQSEIRVQLRSGHQLWVASGFDAAHLGRLMTVLESLS